MQGGDLFFVMLFLLIIVGWLWLRLKRWIYAPRKTRMPLPFEYHDILPTPKGESVKLLRAEGYEVVSGKIKVAIRMKVDPNRMMDHSNEELDQSHMESRLFIDYLAKKDEEWFIVKQSRDRQPMHWTGSGIRDKLMIYALLFERISGVLYVDVKQRQVTRIDFATVLEGGSHEGAETS